MPGEKKLIVEKSVSSGFLVTTSHASHGFGWARVGYLIRMACTLPKRGRSGRDLSLTAGVPRLWEFIQLVFPSKLSCHSEAGHVLTNVFYPCSWPHCGVARPIYITKALDIYFSYHVRFCHAEILPKYLEILYFEHLICCENQKFYFLTTKYF